MEPTWSVLILSCFTLGLLILACVEVGSNDAANLVNAVFGARILPRKKAVWIAGVFVILGGTFTSPVMDTISKGIFNPETLTPDGIIAVFLASYLVNTALLHAFSVYGLPVSSTATLVLSVAGGAFGVTGSLGAIQGGQLGSVIFAIFSSILICAVMGFLFQRIFRAAIRKDATDHKQVVLHGPWITGLMLTLLFWFMVVKGMKNLAFTQWFLSAPQKEFSVGGFVVGLFLVITFLTWAALRVYGPVLSKRLFHLTSLLGMVCMAFAFGQNDLANCAAPGVSILMILFQDSGIHAQVPLWGLFLCGCLMFLGMLTKRAQRVTRAEVNMGSQQNKISLYAPLWCIGVAQKILKETPTAEDHELTPEGNLDEHGKKRHYDALRASVILAVGACVIALASGLGLPISTTYVSFATVVATGWGDQVFSTGQSDVKLGRAIWVVTGWILSMGGAFILCGIAASFMFRFEMLGVLGVFGLKIVLRLWVQKLGDRHEKSHHQKAKSFKSNGNLGHQQKIQLESES